MRVIEKLKNTATEAMTAIASGVGSLFESLKLKELEQTNTRLYDEITKRDSRIEQMQTQMEQMQKQHDQEVRHIKNPHWQELEEKGKDIVKLANVVTKAFDWFPLFKEMLRMEKFCKTIGFTKYMTDLLVRQRKPITCGDRLNSEEHRRTFDIKNDTFRVENEPADDTKLILIINRLSVSHWFKEQWEKLRQSMRPAM